MAPDELYFDVAATMIKSEWYVQLYNPLNPAYMTDKNMPSWTSSLQYTAHYKDKSAYFTKLSSLYNVSKKPNTHMNTLQCQNFV